MGMINLYNFGGRETLNYSTCCPPDSFNRFTVVLFIMTAQVNTILVKSLHFSFIAMKQWKFQNHCNENNESNEIAKEKKLIIIGQIS